MVARNIRVKEFDVVLLGTVLIIVIFGIVTIFSAVHSGSKSNDRLWVAQIIRLAVALVAMLVALVIDYRVLHSFSYILYAIWFVLLSVLLAFPVQSGVRRWFMKGAIQPSELAKIILIIALARYLSDKRRVSGQLKVFITAMVIVLAYTFLIFMQPSLGYALTLIPIALSMFYIGGINEMYLLLLIIPGIVSAGTTILILHKGWSIVSPMAIIKILVFFVVYGICALLGYYLISKTRVRNGKKWVKFVSLCIFAGMLIALVGSGALRDYQKNRLLAFANPEFDPQGAGYHIIQSKIAIGAGGFTGQGYLQGTQNRLDFLPAQHTDFIFSVAAEEWGFLGVALLISFYFVLIARGLKAADRADDIFGILLAIGIVAMIATQVFMNVGMTLGLMPITGVPLPLMSYGGSSLFATFISVGLLLNVRLKRE
jgi:rod shape determining protein RodA